MRRFLVADLEEFLARARKDHPLRPFAQEALGYALEAQGKLDEARAAFEKLREMDVPARADYQAARLALVQGKPDAKQQLERVAKEYPKDLAVVREANERLELASLPPYTPGQATPAPEPASLVLLGGAVGLSLLTRRANRRRSTRQCDTV